MDSYDVCIHSFNQPLLFYTYTQGTIYCLHSPLFFNSFDLLQSSNFLSFSIYTLKELYNASIHPSFSIHSPPVILPFLFHPSTPHFQFIHLLQSFLFFSIHPSLFFNSFTSCNPSFSYPFIHPSFPSLHPSFSIHPSLQLPYLTCKHFLFNIFSVVCKIYALISPSLLYHIHNNI